MPIRAFRPLARLSLACVATLALPALASASTGADFRVVTSSGKTLGEHTQYTGAVRIKTDPDADCFGPGNEGSGDRVRVPGPTALGIVKDASGFDKDLRPISVTDAFSFGLGICGFGGFEAPSDGFWYLKHNHAAATLGGDQLRIAAGDDVLWWLDPDFSDPPPEELGLRAPAHARPGVPFVVKAIEYAADGTKGPAAGAHVKGAALPTNAQGRTLVVLANTARLRARRAGDIPSPALEVCVNANLARCPAVRGRRIVGSRRGDEIDGKRGPDRIVARAGSDLVHARGGDADRVNCGRGRNDEARVDPADSVRNCEEVITG